MDTRGKHMTHTTHGNEQRTWVSLPKNKNSAIKYSPSCCSKPLRPSVMGRTRWEACRSICKHLFTRHGQNISRVEQQQTGKEQARHKSSPVNRWGQSAANVIQGAKRREIIQLHDNSPGRGKQSPNYRMRERDPRHAINFRAGRDQTRNEIRRLGSRHKWLSQ